MAREQIPRCVCGGGGVTCRLKTVKNGKTAAFVGEVGRGKGFSGNKSLFVVYALS